MKQLLCIWIDAFRIDQITKSHTPFLHSLNHETSFKPLKPVFGYSSIAAAFFTGLYPRKSGQLFLYGLKKKSSGRNISSLFPSSVRSYVHHLGRYILGKDFFYPLIEKNKLNQFTPSLERYYHHQDSLKIKTLFNHLDAKTVSYLAYNWPLVASSNSKSRLTPFTLPRDVIQINTFKNMYLKSNPDFALLHLWRHDHLSHKFGVKSAEVKSHLKLLDARLKQLIDQLKLPLEQILIISDHGMVPIKQTKNIQENLPKNLKATTYFIDSASVRFWFKSKSERQQVSGLGENIS